MKFDLKTLKEAIMQAYEKGELSTINDWVEGFEAELRETPINELVGKFHEESDDVPEFVQQYQRGFVDGVNALIAKILDEKEVLGE